MNAMLETGYKLSINENSSGEWDWAVSRFRKVLAGGHAATEKDARAALKKAAGNIVVEGAMDRAKRSALKLRLRGWVERRPYIAMHIFRGAMDGMSVAQLAADADREEHALWTIDNERCGGQLKPLSTHKARKPSHEVAKEMCALIQQLKWKRHNIKAYADDMLGLAFSDPSAEDPIVVVRRPVSDMESAA